MSDFSWIKPGVLAVGISDFPRSAHMKGCVFEMQTGVYRDSQGLVADGVLLTPAAGEPAGKGFRCNPAEIRPLTDPDEFAETDEQSKSSPNQVKEVV